MIKQKPINYGLLIISLLLYIYLGFFVERHETGALLVSYILAFCVYWFVTLKSSQEDVTFWIYSSLLFRTLLVLSVPNLSDDFYRFIWDGKLWVSGLHPFSEIPSYYITNNIPVDGINKELFQELNSPNYFTIYPPVAQVIFWLSVKLSPQSIYGSVILMKVSVLMAEIGSIVVIKKLLEKFNLPKERVLLYALNPLVILELIGNIHLEAILIFFLLLSFLFLTEQKIFVAGVAFSFAVCVKLIPLIFLPAILPVLGWKKTSTFYFVVATTCIILFIPLWDPDIIEGFRNSLGYYFTKFEFNASLYYLVRAWGYLYYGYNIISSSGWILAMISFILILLISTRPWWLKKTTQRIIHDGSSISLNLFETFLITLLCYLLFTTIVHPWYITTLIAITIFTDFRFAIVWSGMIFLTYTGYSEMGYEENLWLTTLEYISVLGYLAYELLWKRKYTPYLS